MAYSAIYGLAISLIDRLPHYLGDEKEKNKRLSKMDFLLRHCSLLLYHCRCHP